MIVYVYCVINPRLATKLNLRSTARGMDGVRCEKDREKPVPRRDTLDSSVSKAMPGSEVRNQ